MKALSLPRFLLLAVSPWIFLLFLNGGCALAKHPPDNASTPPQTAAKNAAPSVAAQLLASASRDSARAGLSLAIPDTVWTGEPFLVRVAGRGLAHVSVSWREKTLSITPGTRNQPPDAALLLLSVLQKQKEQALPLSLTLTWADGHKETLRASIPVSSREYPAQHLKVARKYVKLTPAQEAKVKADQREVREALAVVSPVKYWHLPLLRPMPGDVTSIYGLRRFFNGEERTPHRGIDFDAKTGDPVPTCEDGMVVLVNEHYYGGKTVIIDHGLGVFSLYLHLSAFHVAAGQQVKRGRIIGSVGSTGRVTGPHLHLSLAVLGELVDAAPCLEGMGGLREDGVPPGAEQR